MSSTFSGDETAPFFSFLGATAALVFFLWELLTERRRVAGVLTSMGLTRPELVMKSIVPVVMAGVLGIYGLNSVVINNTGINPKAQVIDDFAKSDIILKVKRGL